MKKKEFVFTVKEFIKRLRQLPKDLRVNAYIFQTDNGHVRNTFESGNFKNPTEVEKFLLHQDKFKQEYYSEFLEEFQNDEIELMGRKCSDWLSIDEKLYILEKQAIDNDEKLKELFTNLEELLKVAKDNGIIKSWFYNGCYHWELSK